MTPKQRELYDYIEGFIAETGTAPSFEEMRTALGLASKSGVSRLVRALAEAGHIIRTANRARRIEIARDAATLRHITDRALLDEAMRRGYRLVRA